MLTAKNQFARRFWPLLAASAVALGPGVTGPVRAAKHQERARQAAARQQTAPSDAKNAESRSDSRKQRTPNPPEFTDLIAEHPAKKLGGASLTLTSDLSHPTSRVACPAASWFDIRPGMTQRISGSSHRPAYFSHAPPI